MFLSEYTNTSFMGGESPLAERAGYFVLQNLLLYYTLKFYTYQDFYDI